jgi:hypothetical protein
MRVEKRATLGKKNSALIGHLSTDLTVARFVHLFSEGHIRRGLYRLYTAVDDENLCPDAGRRLIAAVERMGEKILPGKKRVLRVYAKVVGAERETQPPN